MQARVLKRSSRGSAAVEGLLSATFLGFFAIVMTDFAGGMRSMQQTPRAARHVAWVSERADHEEWPEQPSGTGDMRRLHFGGRGPSPRVSAGSDTIDASDASPLSSLLSSFPGETEFGGKFAHGILPFAGGSIYGTKGTAERAVTGLRLLPNGGSIGASHVVSIRSFPDEKPEEPEGWFAPIDRLKAKMGIP